MLKKLSSYLFFAPTLLFFNRSKRRYIVAALIQIVFPLQTDKTIYYVDAFG